MAFSPRGSDLGKLPRKSGSRSSLIRRVTVAPSGINDRRPLTARPISAVLKVPRPALIALLPAVIVAAATAREALP